MLRNPLLPRARHAQSRRWWFWANTVAGSPYLSFEARKRLYRRLGMDIAADAFEIGAHCYFHSADIRIGAGSRLNDWCWIENTAHVEIGTGVAIGAHAAIITSTHALGPTRSRASGGWGYLPVTIGDGAWIGARCTLLAGVTVGPGAMVAAGAVVAADVEADSLYGGVPARKLRSLDSAREAVGAA